MPPDTENAPLLGGNQSTPTCAWLRQRSCSCRLSFCGNCWNSFHKQVLTHFTCPSWDIFKTRFGSFLTGTYQFLIAPLASVNGVTGSFFAVKQITDSEIFAWIAAVLGGIATWCCFARATPSVEDFRLSTDGAPQATSPLKKTLLLFGNLLITIISVWSAFPSFTLALQSSQQLFHFNDPNADTSVSAALANPVNYSFATSNAIGNASLGIAGLKKLSEIFSNMVRFFKQHPQDRLSFCLLQLFSFLLSLIGIIGFLDAPVAALKNSGASSIWAILAGAVAGNVAEFSFMWSTVSGALQKLLRLTFGENSMAGHFQTFLNPEESSLTLRGSSEVTPCDPHQFSTLKKFLFYLGSLCISMGLSQFYFTAFALAAFGVPNGALMTVLSIFAIIPMTLSNLDAVCDMLARIIGWFQGRRALAADAMSLRTREGTSDSTSQTNLISAQN